MNMIINMLLNQLQTKNPQGFQMINNAMRNGNNPQDILQQMLGNGNNTNIQQVLQQAKQFRNS